MSGNMKTRLQPNATLMFDASGNVPHMMLMQEHLLKKLNTKAFRRIAPVPAYTVIFYSEASKDGHRKGRRSGGLATWIHEVPCAAHNFQNMLTTLYTKKHLKQT